MFLTTPTIPFEVYCKSYNKTIEIVASCEVDKWNSLTVNYGENDKIDYIKLSEIINSTFDKPGITRIQICRRSK